jgi:hypothetical protein
MAQLATRTGVRFLPSQIQAMWGMKVEFKPLIIPRKGNVSHTNRKICLQDCGKIKPLEASSGNYAFFIWRFLELLGAEKNQNSNRLSHLIVFHGFPFSDI